MRNFKCNTAITLTWMTSLPSNELHLPSILHQKHDNGN